MPHLKTRESPTHFSRFKRHAHTLCSRHGLQFSQARMLIEVPETQSDNKEKEKEKQKEKEKEKEKGCAGSGRAEPRCSSTYHMTLRRLDSSR